MCMYVWIDAGEGKGLYVFRSKETRPEQINIKKEMLVKKSKCCAEKRGYQSKEKCESLYLSHPWLRFRCS